MTVATCVCCSMISETQMRYGSRLRFHGSVLRPWRSYQASSRRLIPRSLTAGKLLGLDGGRHYFFLEEGLHEPRADQRWDKKVRRHFRGVMQPRLGFFGGDAPTLDGIAEVAQLRIADDDDVALRPGLDVDHLFHGFAEDENTGVEGEIDAVHVAAFGFDDATLGDDLGQPRQLLIVRHLAPDLALLGVE